MNRNAKLSVAIGVAFGALIVGAIIFSSTGHIEDTNGSLTNLVEINLEQEIEDGGYRSVSFGTSRVETNDYIQYSFSKLSGVTVLESFTCDSGQSISIDTNVELKEGNLRIALVGPSGDIVDWVDIRGEDTIMINGCSTGWYEFIAGAESAKFVIRFE